MQQFNLDSTELIDLGFTDELIFHIEVFADATYDVTFSNRAAYVLSAAIHKTDWLAGLVPEFDKTPIKTLVSTYIFELKAGVRVESQVMKLIRKTRDSKAFISNIKKN